MRTCDSHWELVCFVGIIGIALTACTRSYSQEGRSLKPATGTADTQTIVLPQYPPKIPEGPHVDVFRKHCLSCHTARYITMQPRFDVIVWKGEVKKMADVYGAPISEPDQALILQYLVSIKGPK